MTYVRSTSLILAVLAVMVLLPSDESLAQTFTGQELGTLTQSAGTDLDAVLLYILGGNNPSAQFVPRTVFTFSSSGTSTSWSGTLSGTLVNPFTLNYVSTGDTALSNSWTSSGSLGGIGPVTGSGSVSVTYPTAGTFNLVFSDSLSAGGNTYTLNTSIPGVFVANSQFGPYVTFQYAENVTTNPLMYSGGGSPSYVGYLELSYTYPNYLSSYNLTYPFSTFDVGGNSFPSPNNPVWPGGPWDTYYTPTFGSGGTYTLNGTIQSSVPEPASSTLCAAGLLLMGARAVRRRWRGPAK